MTHDPHCPAPEMCSTCGDYPVPEDHDCEPEGQLSMAPMILFATIIVLDIVLGWAVWTGLEYNGFFP